MAETMPQTDVSPERLTALIADAPPVLSLSAEPGAHHAFAIVVAALGGAGLIALGLVAILALPPPAPAPRAIIDLTLPAPAAPAQAPDAVALAPPPAPPQVPVEPAKGAPEPAAAAGSSTPKPTVKPTPAPLPATAKAATMMPRIKPAKPRGLAARIPDRDEPPIDAGDLPPLDALPPQQSAALPTGGPSPSPAWPDAPPAMGQPVMLLPPAAR
jgi:hypothetical protein